jgi:hypothetical protein
MKIWFALFLVAAFARAADQSPPTPLGHVPQGVYVSKLTSIGSLTILELKEGRFRHWVRTGSNVKEASTALQTGTYSTNGGTARFVVRAQDKRRSTNEWTCVEYKGQTVLWTPRAQELWETRNNKFASGMFPSQVLFATTNAPEELLGEK